MPRLLPRPALLSLWALIGCGPVDEEDYAETLARAECRYQQRCLEVMFWDAHDDMGSCVDDRTRELEDELDFFSKLGCAYQPERARACVDALGASCKDIGQRGLSRAFRACDQQTLFDCD